MKLFCGLLFLTFCLSAPGADITTRQGRKYAGVHDVVIRNGVFSFSTDTEIIKLKLADIPAETIRFYAQKQGLPVVEMAPPVEPPPRQQATQPQVEHFQAAVIRGLRECRNNQLLTLHPADAYSLADLEKAKAQAAQEGKLLGFIMVWDSFFGKPAPPLGQGSSEGLAHFYGVFHEAIVLVFVRHEDELEKTPDAVKKGFFGPDEGGFAPNMAVTDAAAEQFICEIPYGGEKSVGPVRETLFANAAQTMSRYLQTGR